jgi:hypothetical protein
MVVMVVMMLVVVVVMLVIVVHMGFLLWGFLYYNIDGRLCQNIYFFPESPGGACVNGL